MPARVKLHVCPSSSSTQIFLTRSWLPLHTEHETHKPSSSSAPETTISFPSPFQKLYKHASPTHHPVKPPPPIHNIQYPYPISTDHGYKPKSHIRYAKHCFENPCVETFNCDHCYQDTTCSSQSGSGTHKRSSPWLRQWHQDFHVQNVRWPCVQNVSIHLILLRFCLSYAHANQSMTAKQHAPDAKALDSQGQDAVLVPLAQ